jgi:hypothetical protein
MNAVAIADAVHVVTPPRWSVTVTTPREPEMVVAVVEETSVPNAAFTVGVLIESAPAVSVKVMGVAAEAEGAHSTMANIESTANKEHCSFIVIRIPLCNGIVQAEVLNHI